MDLTVAATPFYFGSMAAEYKVLQARAEREGPSAADYERRDTIASLSMGVGSLLTPLVLPRLLAPLAPGKGKWGKVLPVAAGSAVVVTTAADLLARLDGGEALNDADPSSSGGKTAVDRVSSNGAEPKSRKVRRRVARAARKVAGVGGVAAVVAGGLAVTTWWQARTSPGRMWKRRLVRDLGTGPLALAGVVLAWDFIYYWNHRFMHESRFMWAIHVVHHSSERYNLSTALRQPVADVAGTFLPYSTLALVGFRPEMIATARGVNLLYQYWIHTDTIRRLGPAEKVLNTPSHHRVHHGSNRQYLDRNHGSILIIWDRLFGTFEPEDDDVVYGLTKNINTYNPARIATHEHAEMLADVSRSRSWWERLSNVFRDPGWAVKNRERRRIRQERGAGTGAPHTNGGQSPARSSAVG